MCEWFHLLLNMINILRNAQEYLTYYMYGRQRSDGREQVLGGYPSIRSLPADRSHVGRGRKLARPGLELTEEI